MMLCECVHTGEAENFFVAAHRDRTRDLWLISWSNALQTGAQSVRVCDISESMHAVYIVPSISVCFMTVNVMLIV